MNFDFDEDQYSIHDSVARLMAEHELAGKGDADTAVRSGLVELGVLGAIAPEDHGGLDLSLVDVALVVEELGRTLAPLSIVSSLAAIDVIARFGTEAQKRAWLPDIASGETRVSLAWLEAGAGYEPATLATSLKGGRLSGRKIVVPQAAEADLFLCLVGAGDLRPGLVVLPADRAGISVAEEKTLDPTSGCASVSFDQVPVEAGDILAPTAGAAAVQRLADVAETLYAGLLIGAAGKLLDVAVDYARQRVQFDKPIGSFQAIKHRCADMAVAVEAARSTAYYAFWAASHDAPDCTRAAAMAKAYCSEVANSVCKDAIQIHGGIGFTWELGLHWYLRRIKLLEHSFGDIAYCREKVLAETLSMLAAKDEQSDRSAA